MIVSLILFPCVYTGNVVILPSYITFCSGPLVSDVQRGRLVLSPRGRSLWNKLQNQQWHDEPLETIFKSNGIKTVRQGLWVNPPNGDYNLAYNLKLAKRAQAAGLNGYLDMHFSNTCADPGHQVSLTRLSVLLRISNRSQASIRLAI